MRDPAAILAGEPAPAATTGFDFYVQAGAYTRQDRDGVARDMETVFNYFPILREHVNGRPLVWLDNAATTQKPQSVIDRIAYFYVHENSNIHRAAHELAERATDAYEGAREISRRFLNARSVNELVFVRGTTEAGLSSTAYSAALAFDPVTPHVDAACGADLRACAAVRPPPSGPVPCVFISFG